MKKIRGFFKKYFITGLFVILPVWATYYVLTALLGVIDGLLGDLPAHFLGHRFPGLGIITLILFVLLIGVLFANYLGRRIVKKSDELLQKAPLVRGVYFTVKQIMETFSLKQQFHGVGLAEYPRKGCYSVGFMTGETQGCTVGMSVEQGMKFIISLGLVPLSELQANKLKHPAQEVR